VGLSRNPLNFSLAGGIIVASIRRATLGMDVENACLDFPEVKLKIPIDPATSIERDNWNFVVVSEKCYRVTTVRQKCYILRKSEYFLLREKTL
jgi:hypothetical protein